MPKKTGWSKLNRDRQLDIYHRRYELDVPVEQLARELGVKTISLNRRLQEMRNLIEGDGTKRKEVEPRKDQPPNFTLLFDLIRKRPYSLEELSRKFDRSVPTVENWLDKMRDEGYVIEEHRKRVHIDTTKLPKVEYNPARTLADESGQEVVFAVASDSHFGSTHAQISNRLAFIKLAYEEYGVRHIFDPGDLTAGIGGYRGQNLDLVPSSRSYSRLQNAQATYNQVWLADQNTPKLPGLRYYILGGNHDWWHVMNSGIDAVARFCEIRDDCIYLGYDVADVPLTDKVNLRMWHPTGGVPYSISYRLQKMLEQVAFEELTQTVLEGESSKFRILLAGHLHIEVKFQRGLLFAAHVGAFEGQTNYLKRKGLFPTIGGCIFRVRLTDSGLVQRVEYTFVPFNEIKDDWKNYPQPPEDEILQDAYKVERLFSA